MAKKQSGAKTTNYKQVCNYCGLEYQSNRSTSKYCCDDHRALAWYQRKKVSVPKRKVRGVLIHDYRSVLQDIYNNSDTRLKKNGWSSGFPASSLRSLMYLGALPLEQELIVIDGFAIQKRYIKCRDGVLVMVYCLKPAQMLTKDDFLPK